MWKKALALVLAAVFMLLALTGCGKSKYIGKWNITIDLGRAIADSVSDDPFGIDVNFSGLEIYAIVEFNKEGTYSIQLNRDSLNDAVEAMLDVIVDEVYDNIDPTMLGESLEMTKEEYRELLTGYTTADALADNLGIEGSGSYTYEGGKFVLDNGISVVCALKGDTIEINFEKDGYSIIGGGTRAE